MFRKAQEYLSTIPSKLNYYLSSQYWKPIHDQAKINLQRDQEMKERGFNNHLDDQVNKFENPSDRELLKAAVAGDLSKVEAALKEGANVNARDSFGRSVLMCLASNNNIPNLNKVMQFLIDHGANTDYQLEGTFFPHTALQYALDNDLNFKPNWPAVQALVNNDTDLTRKVTEKPLIFYDFFKDEMVVKKPIKSIIKGFCLDETVSYQELHQLHQILTAKLQKMEKGEDSKLPGLLGDVLKMMLFAPSHQKNYFEHMQQLKKEKERLEKVMKEKENKACLRLGSGVSLLSAFVIPRKCLHPSLSFSLAAVILSKALHSINEHTSLEEDCMVIKEKVNTIGKKIKESLEKNNPSPAPDNLERNCPSR